MRVVEGVLVVLLLAVVGFGVYRGVRWFLRPPQTPAGTTAWATRYSVEGTHTVWWIYRDVTGGNGTRRREKQEIKRIDSAAPDFDGLFLQGEQLAQQRAFLLNSALSG
jgi:hypothetical protein